MNPIKAALAPRVAVPERLGPEMLAHFDSGASICDLDGATMGTRWTARIALPPGRDLATAKDAVMARLQAVVDQMSHWDPHSLLSRYNIAAPGSWTFLPDDFAKVMSAGLAVAERSDGAFDPALGRLTDLWGLGPHPADAEPADQLIQSARAASSWRRLAFDTETKRLRQPGGLWLDLSGIAKGYAADAVADRLAELGFHNVLVEVGGEYAGRGIRPDGDPWWVELETPSGFEARPIRIALSQLSVATSGNYLGGEHTLDPATGRPPAHATVAVSVLHASCMMADAWASALCVLPPDHALALAEREQLAVRLLTGRGEERISRAFKQML